MHSLKESGYCTQMESNCYPGKGYLDNMVIMVLKCPNYFFFFFSDRSLGWYSMNEDMGLISCTGFILCHGICSLARVSYQKLDVIFQKAINLRSGFGSLKSLVLQNITFYSLLKVLLDLPFT